MKRISLTQHLIEQQREHNTSPAELRLLIEVVARACKTIAVAVGKAYRAACETRIDGVGTNLSFLQALLKHKAFANNRVNTRFIENHIAELVASAAAAHPHLFFETTTEGAGAAAVGVTGVHNHALGATQLQHGQPHRRQRLRLLLHRLRDLCVFETRQRIFAQPQV